MKSKLAFLTIFSNLAFSVLGKAQTASNYLEVRDPSYSLIWTEVGLMLVFVVAIIYRLYTFRQLLDANNRIECTTTMHVFKNVGTKQIATYLKIKRKNCCGKCKHGRISCNKITHEV
jgi:hypothetical protein